MKLILHIGMPKTGTTALQHFLHKNKDILLSQGIVYEPEIFLRNNISTSSNCHDFVMRFLREPNSTIELLLHRLNKYKDCKYYILSSELFVGFFKQRDIDFLYNNLCEYDIDIVLYIRRQDDYYDSMYKQNVRLGRKKYQFNLEDFEPCYSDIISRWQQNKKNFVRILKYKDLQTINQFVTIYDIEIDDTACFSQKNSTPSRNHIELIDHILKNTDMEFSTLEISKFMRNIDDRGMNQQSPYIYSLSERQEIMMRYEESNAAVSQQYFNGQPLFDPLPEVEQNAVKYPSLTLEDALSMMRKHIFYNMRSGVYIDNLILYIKNRGDFDEKFYRKEYLRGRTEIYTPIEYFVRFGMYTGHKPNAMFDEEKMYAKYPELKNIPMPPYLIYVILNMIGK